ncbi:MAG TPA: ATP-binding protein, partial [Dissulfurispiraceae bacterium]|nr:ATP-binding protein [Dissulfurispiraceae bacterium]
AINAGFILHETLLDTVSTLLKERQARLALRRNAIALFALLSLCVPLYLFIGNYLSVRKALSTLVDASDRIGKGDLAIDVSVDSKDEMTFVAASFNEMARNLARYTEDLKAANSALRDEIGERVKAEEKLEKAVAELRRSNTDLENFAYVASHDLKEPLLVMAMDLKLIERQLRGQVDAESKDLIADTLQRANQMQTLISELLAFSRVGTQAKPFRQTACDEVLDRVLANIKVSVEQSRAVITRDALPTVRADDVQLAQLFQNLVANAIKFIGDEPPRVHISAARGDGEWTFSVRDNGIGIPSDQVEHIFDIFHRAHKDKYPGTGIGLATCKKIVERHGGRIWAEPGPDRGTVFYFTIPDRKEADSAGE